MCNENKNLIIYFWEDNMTISNASTLNNSRRMIVIKVQNDT